MANAQRIPAAQKRPEEFAPRVVAQADKRFADLVIKRASGEVNATRMVLRPGDVVTLDGKTIMEA